MVALSFGDDQAGFDPTIYLDSLKMPETAIHRGTVDLLSFASRQLLGDEVWIFCDLNWYPLDGGNAVAPDLMVLPRSVLDAPPRSYRQAEVDGPAPTVVIEMASDSDTFEALLAKAYRYRRLGTTVHVIVPRGEEAVVRLTPDDDGLISWTGRPIPELGGLAVDFEDGRPVVTMPDGTTFSSVADLIMRDQLRRNQAERQTAEAERQAAEAERQAAEAERQAAEAERRADALAAQLRALGVEPTEPGADEA